jgi:hypothetical protein
MNTSTENATKQGGSNDFGLDIYIVLCKRYKAVSWEKIAALYLASIPTISSTT